jgi:hypothetical protein
MVTNISRCRNTDWCILTIIPIGNANAVLPIFLKIPFTYRLLFAPVTEEPDASTSIVLLVALIQEPVFNNPF